MSRIPLLEAEELPAPLQELHDGADGDWSVQRTTRAFGHHPELLGSYLSWYWPWHTNDGVGRVDRRLKELCRLRIAQLNGCQACAVARYAPDAVQETEAGSLIAGGAGAESLSEPERLALEYAERLALRHHDIDDELVARLREELGDGEFLELSLMIGQYIGFGRVLATLQLEDVACPV